MQTEFKDIIKMLDKYAPEQFAEVWDNVGALLGNNDQGISKILLCLDVTKSVVEEAIENNYNLIISHHPFIFNPFKKIIENDTKSNLIYSLIKNNIAVYCAHTNLDSIKGGVNSALCEIIGLEDVRPFDNDAYLALDGNSGFDEGNSGLSEGNLGLDGTSLPLDVTNLGIEATRIGLEYAKVGLNKVAPVEIDEAIYYSLATIGVIKECTLLELGKRVKERLNLPVVKYIGASMKRVKKVAVFCGSFSGTPQEVLASGVDVVITGELKHNYAIEFNELGVAVIEAGHFRTEVVVLPIVKEALCKAFTNLIVEISSTEKDPYSYIK